MVDLSSSLCSFARDQLMKVPDVFQWVGGKITQNTQCIHQSYPLQLVQITPVTIWLMVDLSVRLSVANFSVMNQQLGGHHPARILALIFGATIQASQESGPFTG